MISCKTWSEFHYILSESNPIPTYISLPNCIILWCLICLYLNNNNNNNHFQVKQINMKWGLWTIGTNPINNSCQSRANKLTSQSFCHGFFIYSLLIITAIEIYNLLFVYWNAELMAVIYLDNIWTVIKVILKGRQRFWNGQFIELAILKPGFEMAKPFLPVS